MKENVSGFFSEHSVYIVISITRGMPGHALSTSMFADYVGPQTNVRRVFELIDDRLRIRDSDCTLWSEPA